MATPLGPQYATELDEIINVVLKRGPEHEQQNEIDPLMNILVGQGSYDPITEFQDFVARSKEEKFIPTFTDDPSVMAAEGDQTHGVGIYQTPEGKWESYQKKKDRASLTDPAAVYNAELPSTGSFMADKLRAAGIAETAAQMEMDAMLNGDPTYSMMSEKIVSLGNSATALFELAQRHTDPEQKAVAGQNAQLAASAASQAQEGLKQYTSDFMRQPKYQMLAAEQKKFKQIMDSPTNKKIADIELSRLAAQETAKLEAEKQTGIFQQNKIETQIQAEVAALKAVPDSVADATFKTGHRFIAAPADARKVWVEGQLPDAQKIVIDQASKNQSNPTKNLLAANLAAPPDQYQWWGEYYLSSIPEADVAGREAGEAFIRETKALRQNLRQEASAATAHDPLLEQMKSQAQIKSGDKKDPEYIFLQGEMERRRQTLMTEYYQDKLMKPLKENLLAGNQDLLTIPKQVVGPDKEIASKFEAFVKASPSDNLDEAIAQFNLVEVPALLESGYSLDHIRVVQRQVIGSYIDEVNARHQGSGVPITTADVQFSIVQPKTLSNNTGLRDYRL